MLVNVNFTETFVIPALLCTIQSVCSLMGGGSNNCKGETAVCIAICSSIFTKQTCLRGSVSIGAYVLECHPHSDNGSESLLSCRVHAKCYFIPCVSAVAGGIFKTAEIKYYPSEI